MDPKKNYYEILGVSEKASSGEIRKAFRRLAKKYHPDVNPGDKAAEGRFKEVNEAHEVLGDEKKRAQYDAMRKGVFTGEFGGEGPFRWHGRFRIRSQGGAPAGNRSTSGTFWGISSGRRPRAGASRGADLAMELPVDFLDMAKGAVKELRYRRPRACPAAADPAGRGAGDARCGGSGMRHEDERIKVKIPAGAKDGSTIRVPGKGAEGIGAGRSGDLAVRLRTIPHPFFRREGSDILIDVPVSYSEAVKGARIPVPTIDGPVTVSVPPGSSSGRKLRLRGRGVPIPGTQSRGDQYVVLQVAVPKERSSEFLSLVEQLAAFEDPNLRGGWN